MHFSVKAALVSLVATAVGVAIIFRVPQIRDAVIGKAA